MPSKAPIDLAGLPGEPGVYRMLDAKRKVLYVGKARNLRKRVSSYFQRQSESPRIRAMVAQIRDIEVTITASEAEALVLEHNLIKQLKPRYNVLLKDSKSYPYILLTEEDFPRLLLHRGRRDRPGTYFGPFPNAGAVHATLAIMQKLFRLRDCEDAVFRNRSRPCMQYQIGRCTAPCCGLVTPAAYRRQVQQAHAFLKGHDQALLQDWQQHMQRAAEQMDFETAAMLRDQIRALRSILDQGERHLPEEADAIVLLRPHGDTAVCIGVRRAGRDLGTHMLRIKQAQDATDEEILQSLLIERYSREEAPKEILIDSHTADASELTRLLRLLGQRKSNVRRPQRGRLAGWLAEVRKTGEQNLASKARQNQQPAFEALARLLELETPPRLIAAVDNAHLGGKQMVAAIVYADVHGPDKDHYRRYKLDDVPAGDDYAAMEAVLQRFFRAIDEGTLPRPDLMLIDGGRGQLAIAAAVAKKYGLERLQLLGVAKGAGRKVGQETLWPAWTMQPLRPARDSAALMLIARVRDEAHRFAGAYMRKRKKKSMFRSSLDGIPGIGPAKRAALLKHFGGIAGVKKAGRDQLSQVPGISAQLADKVFTALHR